MIHCGQRSCSSHSSYQLPALEPSSSCHSNICAWQRSLFWACQFGDGGGLGPQRRQPGPLGGTRGESMSEACFLLEKWRKKAKRRNLSLSSEHQIFMCLKSTPTSQDYKCSLLVSNNTGFLHSFQKTSVVFLPSNIHLPFLLSKSSFLHFLSSHGHSPV